MYRDNKTWLTARFWSVATVGSVESDGFISFLEGVQATMATKNLEPDQWRDREEWRLVSGRRRQLL
jgi:hypothetical protein